MVAILALNIALLIWVARDAKSRGMDNSILWMVLVMLTGIIGLIIYLLVRPQGNLVPCTHCGNKRLQVSAKCPHCGNA
jgi:ABC-type tungstate transport system substrate-binding protein